jgi:hypothetical protein
LISPSFVLEIVYLRSFDDSESLAPSDLISSS